MDEAPYFEMLDKMKIIKCLYLNISKVRTQHRFIVANKRDVHRCTS